MRYPPYLKGLEALRPRPADTSSKVKAPAHKSQVNSKDEERSFTTSIEEIVLINPS